MQQSAPVKIRPGPGQPGSLLCIFSEAHKQHSPGWTCGCQKDPHKSKCNSEVPTPGVLAHHKAADHVDGQRQPQRPFQGDEEHQPGHGLRHLLSLESQPAQCGPPDVSSITGSTCRVMPLQTRVLSCPLDLILLGTRVSLARQGLLVLTPAVDWTQEQ